MVLSSILGKIFDAYVLNRYDNLLTSSPLQFGFKAGYSTSICMFYDIERDIRILSS